MSSLVKKCIFGSIIIYTATIPIISDAAKICTILGADGSAGGATTYEVPDIAPCPPGTTVGGPGGPAGVAPPLTSLGTAGANIATIVGWVVGVFWVVVVLFAVLAAFNYLTAQGSEEKITKAKQMVIYTLIAAAVALLGTGIRQIVTNILTAT
jgi:hypothetical protein